MADNSLIEWTDATWNPVTGCAVVSPGCANCYAMRLAGGRLQHHPSRAGLTTPSKAGPVWNGQVRLNWDWLDQPIRWKRSRKIFVCAHGDLFAEGVPVEWIDRSYAAMMLAPQHTFQVLTKRSERLREYWTNSGEFSEQVHTAALRIQGHALEYLKTGRFSRTGFGPHYSREFREHESRLRALPLDNVWHGVSVEDQARAFRAVDLIQTPVPVRFVSAEPLIGALDLTDVCNGHAFFNTLAGRWWHDVPEDHPPSGGSMPGRIDWVIVGGESGDGSRPMHPEWVRNIRDDCAAAGTAFFFKQWGAWTPGENAGPIADTQIGATYFNTGWIIEEFTRRAAEKLTADDEPDVWRVGKTAAGRLLDGRTHDAMPEVRA